MKLFLALFVICLPFSALAEGDENLKGKVESYLNSITTFTADFTQTDAEGNISGGKFFLKRPGKFKWEYDDRQPILIISDGKELVYYDKKLREASYVSAQDTLAAFLARNNIQLSGEVKLLAINNKNDIISFKVSVSFVTGNVS